MGKRPPKDKTAGGGNVVELDTPLTQKAREAAARLLDRDDASGAATASIVRTVMEHFAHEQAIEKPASELTARELDTEIEKVQRLLSA